ncbi:ABC transporter ATP-binding protein [Roseicyclus amphidinii]|uniref:ABC transporter ATP-binding protein n=1 Tax=Roseicyclus amphidinii TaxID=3034232 RepID=UPI0024E1472C|nr:sn-glycerol-3-phosphate ABC transporter ATP-binding protein UgpC [Roseicyclus sp. Amp-Y-6]
MSSITLNALHKSYGALDVIRDVNLQVDEGEFCIFVGPSGCGKSTLLRMIAGLETITSGEVRIGGDVVNDVAPADRGIAMVFQSYALYPHMTVAQNMSFGLRRTGHSRQETAARVAEAAGILQLGALMDRKPAHLSGGQRQRVAIGRAIVRQPRAFLFDEPLSNLDAELRAQMRVELGQLHKRLGATMIYVTHDQVEAMTLGDKIVVLRDGKVEQVGSPDQLYTDPDNTFVAGFIGSPRMNLIDLHDGTLSGHEIAAPPNARIIGIRPEQFGQGRGLEATVMVVENLGGISILHCALSDGQAILVEARGEDRPTQGARIGLTLPARPLFFDEAGNRLREAGA